MAYGAIGNYVTTGEPISEGLGVWCDAKYAFNKAKRQQCKADKQAAKADRKASHYAGITDMLGPKGGEIPWLPLFGGVAALIVGVWWWRSRKAAPLRSNPGHRPRKNPRERIQVRYVRRTRDGWGAFEKKYWHPRDDAPVEDDRLLDLYDTKEQALARIRTRSSRWRR